MNILSSFRGLTMILLALAASPAFAAFTGPTSLPAGETPEFILARDLDGDDVLDLLVGNGGSICSILRGLGNGAFAPADEESIPSGAKSIVADDFDGDGDLDLALANGSIAILLGEGDGTFGPPFYHSIGEEAGYVASGDLNGDGHPDLATANGLSRTVSVLFGAGDGTFGAPTTTSVPGLSFPAFVRWVGFADMNADEDIDLVVGAGKVVIMPGDGSGGFEAPITILGGGDRLAIGDLDADGDLDIAGTSTAGIKINLANGNGTFGPATTFAAGVDPRSVAIGDLDSDDVVDLAVANYSSSQSLSHHISILRGEGAGIFAAPIPVEVGIQPSSVLMSDLDADGDLDVATANWISGDASVLLNDGGPILSFEILASPNEESDGRFGVSVAGTADMTGDGLPDLLVGGNLEDPGAVPTDSGKAYQFPGGSLSLALGLSSPSPATSGQFGRNVRGLGDITGDGLVDLIVSAPGETSGGFAGAGIVHLFNGATGALIRSHSSPNPEAGGQFGARGNGINDVTGDGKTDVLVSSTFEDPGASPTDAGRVYVFNSQTGALFRTYVSPNEEPNGNFGLNVIGIKDVTGDGKGDLLVGAPGEDPGAAPDGSGVVYLMNGATGAVVWSAASPSPQLAGRFGAVVSRLDDVTGDGKMDVAVGAPDESANGVNAGSGRVHLYNGATGAFLRTIAAPNPQTGAAFGQSIANIPDTNGDGWGDLVVGAPYVNNPGITDAGRVYVISGRNGAILRVIDSPEAEASAEFGFAVGAVPDLDGNGYAEYVIGARKADPGAAPADAGRAYLIYGRRLP